MGMPQITASTARRSSMRCWSSSDEKSFADTFRVSVASVASVMSLVAFIVLSPSCLLYFAFCEAAGITVPLEASGALRTRISFMVFCGHITVQGRSIHLELRRNVLHRHFIRAQQRANGFQLLRG